MLVAVAVRVIEIFGTKDKCFSTLGEATKIKLKLNVFSHLYEGSAEILSTEV